MPGGLAQAIEGEIRARCIDLAPLLAQGERTRFAQDDGDVGATGWLLGYEEFRRCKPCRSRVFLSAIKNSPLGLPEESLFENGRGREGRRTAGRQDGLGDAVIDDDAHRQVANGDK